MLLFWTTKEKASETADGLDSLRRNYPISEIEFQREFVGERDDDDKQCRGEGAAKVGVHGERGTINLDQGNVILS